MSVQVKEKIRGSGDWWVFVYHHGQRTSKKVGKLADAKKVARRAEINISKGMWQPPPTKTEFFERVAQSWLDEIQLKDLADGTVTNYNILLKGHIIPTFGNRRIGEITRADLKDFLLSAKQKYSASYVNSFLVILSGIFQRALDEEIISTLPTLKLKKALGLHTVCSTDSWSFEEVETILATAQKGKPWIHKIIFTALHSGLRIGELVGLQWPDIDFDEGRITINRTYNQKFSLPKSKRIESIQLHDALAGMLKGHKYQVKRDTLKNGREFKQVFTDEKGKILYQAKVGRAWKKILKEAGLPYKKFHTTRKTCGSLLLASGADIYYVSRLLRHSSVQITEKIYIDQLRLRGENPQVNLLQFSTPKLHLIA